MVRDNTTLAKRVSAVAGGGGIRAAFNIYRIYRILQWIL
jgi:hypothetical protein